MWAELSSRPSVRTALLLSAVVLVLHQLAHRAFLIDDSAICFTFARNIAAGEGVVPWPGGERIEAFSDPSWVALLTLFQLVGLDGFTVAKPLAILFGLLTLPLVWRIARLAMPEDDGPAPALAPVFLALSSQYAIWSASGLENPLFAFALALAIERTVTEAKWGGFAGSALAWLLLAWTRPEGVAYAAIGGFWFLVTLLRARKSLRPVLGWLLVFWVPSLVLEGLRYWYFAWPLPQTFYAKIGTRSTFPLDWNQRGWGQLREWAGRLWQGWFFPVYVLGATGRRRVTWIALALVGLSLVFPPTGPLMLLPIWPASPPPMWVFQIRVVVIVAVFALLPFADLGRPGWEARALCWHTAAMGVLFCVIANGDWMGGYRWMSLYVPSLAVLFPVGLKEVVDAVRARFEPGQEGWGSAAWLVAALGIGVWIPPNLNQTKDHLYFNGDETAIRMMMRADYTDWVRRRTFYEGVVNNLEMDQGGTIWERPDYVEVDMAGLVDLPMAHHNYGQRPFIEQYVFGEHEPTFAHVHGWWAAYSAFRTYPKWDDYFPLPANRDLPPAPVWHDGMWANRKLLFAPSWSSAGPSHAERLVGFDQGVQLHGLVVPTSAWPSGGDGYFEVGLSSPPRPPDQDLAVVAFLSRDGKLVASWDLPLGAGLLGMDLWKADEVYVGKFALPVPEGLEPGTYDLGLVVFGADGSVLPAGGALGDQPMDPAFAFGGRTSAPVLANGELRLPNAVLIGDRAAVDRLAAQSIDDAAALARDGKCEDAEQKWILAKRYRPRDWSWHDEQKPAVARNLADCWARTAEGAGDDAPARLAEAHRWDPHSPELARVGAPVGDELWQRGLDARARGDDQATFDTFGALLRFQPWRSWARRYTEEARDRVLKLDTTTLYDPAIKMGKEVPEGFEMHGPITRWNKPPPGRPGGPPNGPPPNGPMRPMGPPGGPNGPDFLFGPPPQDPPPDQAPTEDHP
jgi:hypothetical protein